MQNIYVLSDIHGQSRAFFEMLEKIQFSSEDKLYIIGDVVDRGPDGIKLLEYIREQKNMKLLMGNHEDMLLRTMNDEESWYETWLFNGGGVTLASLMSFPKEEQEQCIQFVKNLPLYHMISVEGKQYLLVHAGIDVSRGDSEGQIAAMERDTLLWIRREFFNAKLSCPYTVIFGHTPTGALLYYAKDLPKESREQAAAFHITRWDRRIAIDCGCAYGENLGCLRLNDQKEFYIKI